MAEDFKLEPTEKDDARDVYKELVEFVGSESTLLFLVISKFMVTNSVNEILARATRGQHKGKSMPVINVETKRSLNIFIDSQKEKKHDNDIDWMW